MTHHRAPAAAASAAQSWNIVRQSSSNNGINQAWVRVNAATEPVAGPVT